MKTLILKDRGIYVKGAEVEMSYPQAQQWCNSGYAEFAPVEQKAAAKPKAEPKKVEAKAEAKAKPKESKK